MTLIILASKYSGVGVYHNMEVTRLFILKFSIIQTDQIRLGLSCWPVATPLCFFYTRKHSTKIFDTLASGEQSIDNSSSPENNINMSREGHAVGYQPALVPFSANANARFLSIIMK